MTNGEKVFLEYHHNSPWAQAKVAAGLNIPAEAVEYMQRELDERARHKAEYEARLKDEQNATQRSTETPAPGPADQREPAAAGLGGLQVPAPGDASAD